MAGKGSLLPNRTPKSFYPEGFVRKRPRSPLKTVQHIRVEVSVCRLDHAGDVCLCGRYGADRCPPVKMLLEGFSVPRGQLFSNRGPNYGTRVSWALESCFVG